MFEMLPLDFLTPAQAVAWFGVILGSAYGVLALVSRFCLRRAIAGDAGERAEAGAGWLVALAVAVAGTQIVLSTGLIDLSGNRFVSPDLPVLALVIGGALFGAGMVLARGCAARLTVLSATGNLRALGVMVLFAIVAHASMKGLLAPLRLAIASVTVETSGVLSVSPAWIIGVLVVAGVAVAVKGRVRWTALVLPALIGALVPLAWGVTGYVLNDPFDPIAAESLAFTAPWADTLFYVIASTAIAPGFGAGLITGVLGGAFLAAVVTGRFQWQSFETSAQTGRYAAGAVLMGFGGVLAGGCTIGAGLSGVPLLSVSAIVALVSIIAGGVVAQALLRRPARVALVAAE